MLSNFASVRCDSVNLRSMEFIILAINILLSRNTRGKLIIIIIFHETLNLLR